MLKARTGLLVLLLLAQAAAICDVPPVCDANKTTSQCGHTFTGCNVCDSCCNWGGKADCPGCLQANTGCVSYECSDDGAACKPVKGDSGTYATQAACDANCKPAPRCTGRSATLQRHATVLRCRPRAGGNAGT